LINTGEVFKFAIQPLIPKYFLYLKYLKT